MTWTDPAAVSVFVLYRQPDYDAFFSDADYDGSPAPDEGQEWQLGVFASRERAEAEKALCENRRTPEEANIIFIVDEFKIGELYSRIGFFVDEE
jgi:hypothetical protein